MDLELLIQLFDLANEDELHAFKLFDVSVFGFFTESFEILGHLLQFGVLLVGDSLDHFTELLSLKLVGPLDVLALHVVLSLDDVNVTDEFLVKTAKTTLLESDEVINMDEMVSQSHLVLLFSLIQVTIVHLNHSFLGVNLSIMILLVDLDVFLELLRFGETQDLSPVGKDLHSVEMSHLLFILHLLLEVLSLHLNSLKLILNISESSCLILDLDGVPLVFVGSHTTSLNVLA